MWWLAGLLAGLLALLAAASSNSSRNSVVSGVSRLPESASRALTYRSRDGCAFFRFRFTPLGSDIRIHILEFPKRQVGSCHVLHDSHGPYICWSGAISSMPAARAVASMWAEATLVYQRTGRTF
jgi:hypothetical protein